MHKKILLGPSRFGHRDSEPLDILREAGFEILPNPFGRKLTKKELVELLPGVDGLIAGLETIDKTVLAKSRLAVISRCGSGITNVDMDAVRAAGIRFYFTPYGPTEAVAELTMGMMIALLRCAIPMDAALRKKQWEKKNGRQLQGMRVLIVGYGRIGRRVAELLRPFHVHISIADPDAIDVPDDVHTVSLHEGLAQADIVCIHAAGDRCILGPAEFSAMKEGVYILNAARGGLLEESLLLEGLESGRVAGAWLDSFAYEPYQGPLCGLSNVILTPHVGSYTREGRKKMEMEAARNLIAGFEGLS